VTADSSEILLDGPWRHRFVAANGARFHVAEAGGGPLVILLHGFPQFWWAWRHQLPALADAGYHAVAMDLRGYGASDKPPALRPSPGRRHRGVVRALGERRAVVVGHGWGWVAWSMPAIAPGDQSGGGPVNGAPVADAAGVHRGQRRTLGPLLAFQTPMAPEHWLEHGNGVERLLREWSGPGFPDDATLWRYQRAMQVPFVAHTSMEYYRWAVRSLWRRDGRRFAATVQEPVKVPVLQMHGAQDPWVSPRTASQSAPFVHGRLRYELVPGAGHFLPEEAPDRVTATLLDWLHHLPVTPPLAHRWRTSWRCVPPRQ
jgi:pimeloyl-ACP methyl ester carboxylesterase